MPGPIFAPVMEPYDVRVIAIYLAQAFNGDVMEVPPTRSPVWGLASRMAVAMRRDNYLLGAYARSDLIDSQRPHRLNVARAPGSLPRSREKIYAE